jgi:hypothetical protein
MMSHLVYANNVAIDLDNLVEIGNGGEGVVYRYGQQIIKIFHTPSKKEAKVKAIIADGWDHPNIAFPKAVVTDKNHNFIGYVAPYFESNGTILTKCTGTKNDPTQHVLFAKVFATLYVLIKIAHKAGFVIGDFNNTNFIYCNKSQTIYLIDVDNWGYKSHKVNAEKPEFLPPEYLKTKQNGITIYPTQETDWFGFTTMLFRVCLGADPYSVQSHQFAFSDFKMRSICYLDPRNTIFGRDVRVRMFLPSLLRYFIEVFERGKRGEFPAVHLENMNESGYAIKVISTNLSRTKMFDEMYKGVVVTQKPTTVKVVQKTVPLQVATNPPVIPTTTTSFSTNPTSALKQTKNISIGKILLFIPTVMFKVWLRIVLTILGLIPVGFVFSLIFGYPFVSFVGIIVLFCFIGYYIYDELQKFK